MIDDNLIKQKIGLFYNKITQLTIIASIILTILHTILQFYKIDTTFINKLGLLIIIVFVSTPFVGIIISLIAFISERIKIFSIISIFIIISVLLATLFKL